MSELTKFFNADVDATLGGLTPSDTSVPSQKAIKSYVDTEDEKKVDKVTGNNRVYGTDSQGNQTSYDYDSFGKVDDVKVGTTSVVTNKIASLGTMAGEDKADYVGANTAITAGTKCKITYDSKGLVTAGTDLQASDIPDLSSTYQAKLESGTNIKTVNNNSLLGSGNLSIDSLPSQTGQSGKFLTTDGSSASWATVSGVRNPDLFDYKWTDHILNDPSWLRVDTFSWQAGSVYEAAYQHLVDDLRNADQNDFAPAVLNTDLGSNNWYAIAWNGTKFVALGSAGYISTSTDGTTWTTAIQDANLGSHTWRAIAWDGTKFVALGGYGTYVSTSTDGTTWTTAIQDANLGSHTWNAIAWDGTKFVALGSAGYISASTDGTTWTEATQNANLGNHLWNAIAWDGTKFVALGQSGYVSTSTDGTTWTEATQNANLGNNSFNAIAWNGTKFVVLGRYGYISYSCSGTDTISGTTISYFTAPDGHKIVLADQEGNVSAIYNSTGVAWYYILDTINERFKLPRTKFGVTGLRDTVGNYVAPGLPSIAGKTGMSLGGSSTDIISAPFYVDNNGTSITGTNTSSSYRNIKFNAALSSSIYGNSTTVQPPATQMYLYFYVGEFTQTALENTAGITAETLNDKVDVGHQVIAFQAPTAGNNYTWYRKYADGWVEQGGIQIGNSVYGKATVNLPVEMADNTYQAFGNIGWVGESYWYTHSDGVSMQGATDVIGATTDKTTTTFSIQSFSTHNWYVCGMAA